MRTKERSRNRQAASQREAYARRVIPGGVFVQHAALQFPWQPQALSADGTLRG